jgi:hypothetical protein
MKISKNFPQFKNEKALIVVVGKQEGKFYFANEGIIENLDSFKFEKPKYSDREGHFTERGERGVYKRGAVYEPKKERIITELVNRLGENVKKLLAKNEADIIYLTCPDYLKKRVKDSFPDSAKKKTEIILTGNYCDFHPFDLLEKMKDKIKGKRYFPVKKEEKKIIEKSERARKIIKGKPKT